MADIMVAEKLAKLAKEFRKEILITIANAGSGHPGGSLSAIDILTMLYFYKMRHNPHQPKWPDRDRFVLSKGHACPALYVVLANAGYFPRQELMGFRKLDSMLQGHSYNGVPGIDVSTGALGQGLSIANGMAIAGKLDNKSFRVYVLLGDGELQEGEVWEAAKSAANYKLDNLTAIVDRNGLQQNGPTEQLMRIEPLAEKFRAFGWHVQEINGHDAAAIMDALDAADKVTGQPRIIIARTVKGKGVSFMENNHEWHGKAPNQEQLRLALAELSK